MVEDKNFEDEDLKDIQDTDKAVQGSQDKDKAAHGSSDNADKRRTERSGTGTH